MKKLALVFLAVSLLIFPLTLVVPQLVSAQEMVETAGGISQKQSLLDEIAEVDRTYKGQLAEYRTAADQFNIAKGQFAQLNTLASLEVAVQAGRKALLLRDQVLSTYLKLIELRLFEADGINLEEKALALERAKTLQRDFQAHYDLTNQALDRVALNQVTDDFEVLSPQISSLANYASELLKLGKLQTVYDHALSLVEKTTPVVADGAEPSLKYNEQVRAHTEVQKLMAKISGSLRLGWDEIREARLKDEPIQNSKSNASVFADLSQVLRFLAEIVKNI